MTNFERITLSARELSCWTAAQIIKALIQIGITDLEEGTGFELSNEIEDWLNEESEEGK